MTPRSGTRAFIFLVALSLCVTQCRSCEAGLRRVLIHVLWLVVEPSTPLGLFAASPVFWNSAACLAPPIR